MLNRQKALIYMLEQAARPVSRMELTKWSFLLWREMPSRGGAAFYQFVPYLHGPFSFCLYREADNLVKQGLLDEVDAKRWMASTQSQAVTGGLPAGIKNDISGILQQFAGRSVRTLVEYVYGRYPWFTVNSERERKMERPVAEPAIYTAGCEGLSVDGFLNMLIRHGIKHLIDVRRNPVARRYGYHKKTLDRLCGLLDLEYTHVPELGIESRERQNLQSPADYRALFERYESETLRREIETIRRVSDLMTKEPSALFCVEAHPSKCHRSRVADAVASITSLPVLHLEPVG